MHNRYAVASKQDRTLGMLCHLLAFSTCIVPFGNFLGPLILWLVKRDTSDFVDFHGKESLNFQISVTIWALISGLLCFVIIGIPMLIAVAIGSIVFTIIAAVKANDGVHYEYPMTFRFLK